MPSGNILPRDSVRATARAEFRPTVAECADVADWWRKHRAKNNATFRARLRSIDINLTLQLAAATGMTPEHAETLCRALAYVERDEPTLPVGVNILADMTTVPPLHRARFKGLYRGSRHRTEIYAR